MLISPAEPRELRLLGNTSAAPEKHGADFLWYSKAVGMVGVQRKEINDLLASLADDRLAREIPLLQRLDIAMVLIEGRVEWTNDGFLLATSSPFTRAQYLGILWSLQSAGLWIGCSDSLTDTTQYLSAFYRWTTKERHTGLLRRTQKAGRDEYGMRSDRAWQLHLLQGFPGVGYERAKAIVEYYGGLPLAWTGRLVDVDGIGPVTAHRLETLLTPLDSGSGAPPATPAKSGSPRGDGNAESCGDGA